MSGREPGHAEFEPMALTPRKRRADPVLLGAVVVVVGLLVAVVKPWGDSATGEADASIAPAGSASIGAPTTGRPSSSPRAPAAEAAPAAIAWPRAAVAISPRDAWGVRAIVRDPDVGGRTSGGTAGLVERWSALTPGVAGTGVARLETADQGVLALGITFPPDELPIDARVWRSTEDDAWEWLYAVPLGPTPATGAFLFAPPAIDGSSLPTWPTGSYRIQVLAGPTIREIEVRLPDRFEVVPGPAEASAGESAESPFDPVFRSMSPDRPFVVQAGIATPLVGEPTEPMDLVTAWRDTGTAPADRAHDLVPSVVAPKATGLGVMAPIDAVEASASIVAIAPEEHAVDARRAPGLWFTEDGRAPYVIFRAPRGGHWPPGTYRINAAWTQDGARRATSYHVELLPGAGASTDPLAALRLFAPVAGTEAIVGAAGLFATSRDLTCGDGDLAALPEVPAVIGIGHAQGDAPDAVEATLLLAGGRTVDQPLLVAAEAIDGLTLIAPANGPTFVPGIHRLTLRSGGEVRTVTACVGVGIPD